MGSRRRNHHRNHPTNFKVSFTLTRHQVSFIILAISILILLWLAFLVGQTLQIRTVFAEDMQSIAEKKEQIPFSIQKIVFYSSADAIRNDTVRDLWDLTLYQYTDIAIYIDNESKEGLSHRNTVKEIAIEKIAFSNYEKGTPSLAFKNRLSFGKSAYEQDSFIQDSASCPIVTTKEEEKTEEPSFYETCQTPLVLQYVNESVKEHAILSNTSGSLLTFNGSLLKKASIPLSTISTSVSFLLKIKNNANEEFICPIYFVIPLEDLSSNKSIEEGYFQLEVQNPNYVFYQK